MMDPVTFVETKLFTKLVQEYLSDDERLGNGAIWMLTLYAKNVADNIPLKMLKKIKEEIDAES